MRTLGFAFLAVCLALVGVASRARAVAVPATPIAIVVDAGPFASAAEAEVAEARVDWMDLDPSDDTACTEAFAAFELLRWWARADHRDSTTIRVVPKSEAPARGLVVYVGRAAATFARDSLADVALPALPDSPDGYRLVHVERGARRVVLVEGRSRTGTLYGAYDLIERLGVRFFGPDPEATIVPPKATPLPRDLAVVSAPAFAVRGFWAWEPRGERAFWLWMARHRMNQWTAVESDTDFLHKLGMTLTIGGHDLQHQFLDPDGRLAGETRTRREAHPDWYGTHGGASGRSADSVAGQNFCTTHPEAQAAFVSAMRDAWTSGPWREADEVVLWMSDAGTWCSCSRCVATGTPTERLVLLGSALADTLDAAAARTGRRAPMVSTLAFLETLQAPPAGRALAWSERLAVQVFPMDRCYAHALDDTACEQTNASFARALRDWTRAAGAPSRHAIGLGEYYNIDRNKGLPFVPTAMMARDLAFVHGLGVRRFTTMHAPTRLWGPWEWTHLELATLLWDPAADVASLRADYVSRAFPVAGRQVNDALDHLEFASSGMKQLLHRIGTPYGPFDFQKQIHAGKSPTPPEPLGWSDDGPEGPRSPGLADRLSAARAAQASLAAASTRTAKSPAEHARVARQLASVAYFVDMLAFYDAFLRADALAIRGDKKAARAQLARLDPIAARLRRVVDLVQTGASHSNARDGLEATGLEADWVRLRQSLAAAPASPLK